jgi:acyl-CoA reductase-like NAD-dependent aldehyde dehydrogenase
MKTPSRLPVLKTCKLFIGGKFPRSESGRVLPALSASGTLLANVCHGSRKDLRDAVTAARKAAPGWAAATAYLRSQILYRLAEILESRAALLTAELIAATAASPRDAESETATAIDSLISLAGWPDKLPQLFGTVNPVAAPFFSFTSPEPSGVTVIFAPDTPALTAPVSLIASSLAAGNPCILAASERFPTLAISLAEAIAVSDIPSGTVNILSGPHSDFAATAASHHDIDCILDANGTHSAILRAGSASNLKRVVSHCPTPAQWQSPDFLASPWLLSSLMDAKTTWHPIGI